ncbi:MAG: hypothetical protein LKJ83_03965 [Eubacteriaceae bacterium]|nr:hypothetical protein [Eubacteriaceae bacterium]
MNDVTRYFKYILKKPQYTAADTETAIDVIKSLRDLTEQEACELCASLWEIACSKEQAGDTFEQ